jgi:hypothetical protein
MQTITMRLAEARKIGASALHASARLEIHGLRSFARFSETP